MFYLFYPRTERSALKRLLRKTKKAIRTKDFSDFGAITECPLCQWATCTKIPFDISKVSCEKCTNTFGKELGFNSIERKFQCLNTEIDDSSNNFGNLFCDFATDDERIYFLKGLISRIENALASRPYRFLCSFPYIKENKNENY